MVSSRKARKNQEQITDCSQPARFQPILFNHLFTAETILFSKHVCRWVSAPTDVLWYTLAVTYMFHLSSQSIPPASRAFFSIANGWVLLEFSCGEKNQETHSSAGYVQLVPEERKLTKCLCSKKSDPWARNWIPSCKEAGIVNEWEGLNWTVHYSSSTWFLTSFLPIWSQLIFLSFSYLVLLRNAVWCIT